MKLALFTDADDYLEFIFSNWDQLVKDYYIPASKNNLKLIDKEQLADFAEKKQIKVPNTFHRIDDIKENHYPLIIKPLKNNRIYSKSRIQTEKAYICYRKEQLIQTLNFLKTFNVAFIIQQMIEGGVNNIYDVLLYRGSNGKIKIGYVARKLRSFPLDFGAGSALITETNSQLIQSSINLMESANYLGVAEFEYKFCEKTKQFYLIEVNGRFPLQSGILHKYNSGLIADIFRDLIHLTDKDYSVVQIDKKVIWIYLPGDIRAIIKEKQKMVPTFMKLLLTYTIQDAIWSWTDPLPVVFYPKYILKRLRERSK